MPFQLTEEQLYRSIRSLNRQQAAEYLPHFNAAIAEFGIDTPLRVAHFIGQIAHESGDLKFWEEIWEPTETQKRYALRADLGNTNPPAKAAAQAAGFADVGEFFKGHGAIQTTGYRNHKRVADRLGIDCVTNPKLLCEPLNGFRAAGLFWQDNALNTFADRDDIRNLTRRINGGYNGFEDRVRKTKKAKAALGLPTE